MNLFDQIINQSKLGTSGQFSGGASFGSINTQDFQSKAPTIQKSVQAEQSLLSKGYSPQEVNFLKIQKQKGIDPKQSIAFVQKKRQEAKGFASDANREGFLENAMGVGADLVGGAVSQVPKFLGETSSFLAKAGQYNPFNLAGAAIGAGLNPNETYGSLREKQKLEADKLATLGQKGKALVQSTGLYDPESTSAKVGEFVTDIGGSIIGPNKVGILKSGAKALGAGKKLATTAKIGDIALEGGLAGAKYDIGTKGEITPESVGIGAIGNVGLAGALKGGKALTNRYTGANISTRANRFTAGDEEKFIRMTGETPGKFATARGMTAVGEDAVKQSSQFYKASMDKADEALSKIDGAFSTKGQTDDILGDLMEGNLAKIKAQPRNPDVSRVNALYSKYESGQGLTMSEINEAKRIFAKNHKFNWDQRASDSAVNATNLQNDLRKWQMKLAEESGLENLADINKTTQAWKSFADSLEKRLDRSGANNLVSLSDWVALSGGNPTNLALFAGKKAFELPGVKSGAIKLLSKQTKPSIIEPTTEKILKTNLQKKYANPNVSASVSTISDKSLVKPRALLSAPSKETMQRKENVELSKRLLKERQAKEAITKQSDITSKSKIVRPLSLAEKNEIAELKSLQREISRDTSFTNAKAREDFASKIKGVKAKMLDAGYRKIIMQEEANIAKEYLRTESGYGDGLTRAFKKLEALGNSMNKGPKDLIESRNGKTYRDFTDEAQSYINKISDGEYSNLTPDDIFEEMRNVGALGTSRKPLKPFNESKVNKLATGDTIPEGYFKNAFGEIIKKPSNKKGGFIKIAPEPKKLAPSKNSVSDMEKTFMKAFKNEYQKDSPDISRIIRNAKKMGLTEIDAKTVFRHTDPETGNYHTFQKQLREGNLTKDSKIFYSTLNSTLEKLPKHEGNVYRGIGSPRVKELLNKLKEGDTFVDNGFLSTSKLEAEAEYFQGGNKVMMVMDSKTGRDIHKLSASPDELEIIFKPGTKFKFNGKTTQGYDTVKTRYYFEEI